MLYQRYEVLPCITFSLIAKIVLPVKIEYCFNCARLESSLELLLYTWPQFCWEFQAQLLL